MLPDDPSDCSLRFWLRNILNLLAEALKDLLILSWEPPKDVFCNNHSFLDSDGLTVLDDISDDLDGPGDSSVNLQDYLPDGLDGGSYQIHVHIVCVILELVEDHFGIFVLSNLDQDVDFLQLHVDGVVELAEENLHVVLEDSWLLLKHKVDVSQGDILDLCLA